MDSKFAIYNFLTGIECKNEKPTYDEAYKRAFQLAWKDMATHTLKISENFKDEYNSYFNGESKLKTENRKWLKEQMSAKIRKYFDKLLEAKNKDDFSDCHQEICKYLCGDIDDKFPECIIEYKTDSEKTYSSVKIEDTYTHMDDSIKKTFTYGQAQKLVNMLVKYMYIYHDLYEFECPADVTFNVELYHVPIDSIILKEIGKSNICWSKINDYKKYENIQEKINKKVEEENSFIWELNVWNNRNK